MKTAQWPSLTVVILLIFVCVMPPDHGWGQEAERIGTVLVAAGTAEVQPQGSATWEALRFRDPIFRNATVRTGSGSKVKLILRDNSVMTLAEHSELQFSEFLLTPQQRRLIVTLTVGTLLVLAERHVGAGSVAEVHTANAVVGVEGTTFIVKYIPPDTTDIVSFEGLVAARNRALMTLDFQPVLQNFRTNVVGAAPPTKAAEVSAETRQQLLQEVQVIAQSPQAVLTSAELQSMDTSPDPGSPQPPVVVVFLPEPPPPAPVVVRETPVPDPEGSVQSRTLPPEVALSHANILIDFLHQR